MIAASLIEYNTFILTGTATIRLSRHARKMTTFNMVAVIVPYREINKYRYILIQERENNRNENTMNWKIVG